MKKFMFAAVAAAGIAAVSIGASVTIDGVSWTYKVLNSSAGYVMLGGGTSEKPALAKTVQLNADSIPWTFEDRGRLYTVTEVGPYAFNECLIEGTLNIPPSVKKIGNRAFRKCSGIIQLDGMTNVTSVAEYAFFMCDNMASSSSSLHLEKASLLTGAFSGCSKFMNAQGSIMSVKNGTATLHPDLFNQNSMTGVIIPDTVTTVKDRVFQGSSALKAVVIPGPIDASKTCSVVANSNFANSPNLKYVMFGQNAKCSSKTIYNDNMFKDVPGCTVFAPKSGFSGVKFGGVNTDVVLYGSDTNIDITVDFQAKVITAYCSDDTAIGKVEGAAPYFKTYCGGYTTRIISKPQSTGGTSSGSQSVEYYSSIVYYTPNQSEVDAVYNRLSGNVQNVIFDMTGATENITMPGDTNTFINVRMQGGAKYISKKREFSIIIR